MKAGFFVTGTDTDIGKTWTTIALMRGFQRQGLTVAGMKPVAAGCVWRDGVLQNSDALMLQAYASQLLPYDRINPYAFELAVSPHLACGDVEVRLEVIGDAFDRLRQQADIVLVEGAGGWYSPLSRTLDNAALAHALGLPVILVVGIMLGCINHARLTVQALRQSGLPFAGWVAVQIVEVMPGFESNLDFLREVIDAPLIGVLPHSANADFESLATHLSLPNWRKFDLHQNI
ncbi:dethiobiotin synthase [Methylomonas sp. 2BW1-5-20]|uniref:dethiobiotin synthase n=1 Tax=Methylomonas sp. 2BW1-5-20 TaxID=3376686 RepID=UPI00404BC0FF